MRSGARTKGPRGSVSARGAYPSGPWVPLIAQWKWLCDAQCCPQLLLISISVYLYMDINIDIKWIIICIFKDFSMMYRTLWDRGHDLRDHEDQSVHEAHSTECTDVSDYDMNYLVLIHYEAEICCLLSNVVLFQFDDDSMLRGHKAEYGYIMSGPLCNEVLEEWLMLSRILLKIEHFRSFYYIANCMFVQVIQRKSKGDCLLTVLQIMKDMQIWFQQQIGPMLINNLNK